MNDNQPRQPRQPRAGRRQPLRALKAISRLVRNPQDTELVFHIMDALMGRNTADNLAKVKRMRPELVLQRSDVLARLSDREALARLPEGSLGRSYLAFCEREGISADGLVQASEATGRRHEETELGWFERRMRDTHDLWHVVTSYGTHPFGEVGVVTFSFAQTGHLGFGLIGFVGALKHAEGFGLMRTMRLFREAYRNGRSSGWFPAQDWEALLALPLSQVRAMLGVTLPAADAPMVRPMYPAAV
jgi:ubiquinone biosynthesis protein COQ4